MRVCAVMLRQADPPVPLERWGTAKAPGEFIATAASCREHVPGFLRRLRATSAPIEERELLTVDQSVIVRTGTIYADRRIVWRRG